MSGLLSQVKENQVTKEVELKDYSGSSYIRESGIYDMKVAMAFAMQSEGGAIGIYVRYEGDAQLEDTMWITNKEGMTYFTRNGKDTAMPSYVDAKKMHYLFTGDMISSVGSINTENRIIKHFKYVEDPENEGKKKKVDNEIEAEVLVDWIGKEVKLLVQMVQKEGWDKDAKKPSGIGAVTKDGEPITDPIIIDRFNNEGKTANELFKDKDAETINKGLARIEKTPIRMFNSKKDGGTKQSNSGVATKSVKKPNIFG